MNVEIKRVPVEITKYNFNGKTYDTYVEAERERDRAREQNDPVLRYSRTYSGKKLLDMMSLNDVGTFLIKDEGPVDYGSSGHPILLKVVHGTLRNAILDAFKTKGFVGYGPGHIEPVEVQEV